MCGALKDAAGARSGFGQHSTNTCYHYYCHYHHRYHYHYSVRPRARARSVSRSAWVCTPAAYTVSMAADGWLLPSFVLLGPSTSTNSTHKNTHRRTKSKGSTTDTGHKNTAVDGISLQKSKAPVVRRARVNDAKPRRPLQPRPPAVRAAPGVAVAVDGNGHAPPRPANHLGRGGAASTTKARRAGALRRGILWNAIFTRTIGSRCGRS